MAWKEFTDEEIEMLKSNSYTTYASPKVVRFSVGFKERFWDAYQNGENPRNIVADMGYDPDTLGKGRLGAIVVHLKEEMAKYGAFKDKRRKNAPEERTKNPAIPQSLVQMQCELAYVRQEVEFIKKIISADRKGKR